MCLDCPTSVVPFYFFRPFRRFFGTVGDEVLCSYVRIKLRLACRTLKLFSNMVLNPIQKCLRSSPMSILVAIGDSSFSRKETSSSVCTVPLSIFPVLL